MKRILITGANSYIGTSFEKYIKENYSNDFQIDTLDMINQSWKEYDFSKYHSILHVAGIAHKKETKKNAHLYYEVNRDLAISVANKAKESNVKQFIFMSSMSVYGLDHSNELITVNTPTNPKSNYGKSKLEAERALIKLQSDDFKITILRPPMVYGKGCPGNMTKLLKAVRKFHVFPTIKNERSSISINKLCEEIRNVTYNCQSAIYLPQNREYMCTYKTVKEQMKDEQVKVLYISIFNPIIRLLIGRIGLITKAFGNLKYGRMI